MTNVIATRVNDATTFIVLYRRIHACIVTVQLYAQRALLDWVGEYAVRAYTTPGSAVSYSNQTQMA